MTLPVTIGSVVFPAGGNNYLGPFKSSAGNIFVFVLDSTDAGQIEAHRATDPTSSFSESDSGNKPDEASTAFESLWCYREGDIIHIVSQSSVSDTGDVHYHTFDMSGNGDVGTWGTVSETVESPGDVPLVIACSIAVMKGFPIILYQGNTDKEMGVNRDRIDYAKKDGTWTVGILVAKEGTALHWRGAVIVPGPDSGDRLHFFFGNNIGDDAHQRTLANVSTATPDLETFPGGDLSAADENFLFGHGVGYWDGANYTIRVVNGNAGAAEPEMQTFTSADAPGTPTASQVSGRNMQDQGDYYALGTVAIGTDHYTWFVGTSRDLWENKNDGSDLEVLDAVTINFLSMSTYDRGGDIVIAYLYDDGGTVKYGEAIRNQTALTALSAPNFADQNYYHGPFKT